MAVADPPWFAFIIHPRNVTDLLGWQGARLLRQYSDSEEDFVRKATSVDPIIAGEVLFRLGGPRGELIGVVRLPRQILTRGGRTNVADAVQLAASRGAKVIGLGALTAPTTLGGTTLIADVPAGVAITTGNAYTSIVARSNVESAAEFLGLPTKARVAILGATGSVGVPASRMLVERGYPVRLVGRSVKRVDEEFADLRGRVEFSDNVEDLRNADIVLVVTSGAGALVGPQHVRPGAVVIDMTQPTNIDEAAYDSFRANGSWVVAGGRVRIPFYRSTYNLPTGGPADTFACLAETYLMSREGLREHSVGTPTVESALRMERVAKRHNVAPSPLEFESFTPAVAGPNLAVAGTTGRL